MATRWGIALLVVACASLSGSAVARAALDLDNVSIAITRLLPAETYQFRVDVEGAMLTDVTVTPPGGPPLALVCSGAGFADCNHEATFASASALAAAFPPGSYQFEFNGAASSISLAHRGFVPPSGFASPDYAPKQGGSCTSTTPTLSWTCGPGCQAATQLDCQLGGAGGEIFNASYVPPAAGSVSLPSGPFVPAPSDLEGSLSALVDGNVYAFSCSTEDLLVTIETLGADAFEYSDESKIDAGVGMEAGCTSAVCGNGVLETGEACDDGNDDAGDCCSPTCQLEAEGSTCDDGSLCTDGDTCDAAGSCQPGPPLPCDNGLFCDGAETCDPLLGCQPGSDPCAGSSCDESGDACTAGCVVDADCDNGLLCDGAEVCSAGSCSPGNLPTTFAARGMVSLVPAELVPAFSIGQEIEASFSFDASTPDSSPDPTIGSYDYQALEFAIHGYSGSSDGGQILVVDDEPGGFDIYRIQNPDPDELDAAPVNGWVPIQASLQLTDSTATGFASDALPALPPDLEDFAGRFFRLTFADPEDPEAPSVSLRGILTSLEIGVCTEAPPPAVPGLPLWSRVLLALLVGIVALRRGRAAGTSR